MDLLVGDMADQTATETPMQTSLICCNTVWCGEHGWYEGTVRMRQVRQVERMQFIHKMNMQRKFAGTDHPWEEATDLWHATILLFSNELDKLLDLDAAELRAPGKQSLMQVCQTATMFGSDLPRNGDFGGVVREYMQHYEVLTHSTSQAVSDLQLSDPDIAARARTLEAACQRASQSLQDMTSAIKPSQSAVTLPQSNPSFETNTTVEFNSSFLAHSSQEKDKGNNSVLT